MLCKFFFALEEMRRICGAKEEHNKGNFSGRGVCSVGRLGREGRKLGCYCNDPVSLLHTAQVGASHPIPHALLVYFVCMLSSNEKIPTFFSGFWPIFN